MPIAAPELMAGRMVKESVPTVQLLDRGQAADQMPLLSLYLSLLQLLRAVQMQRAG